MTKNLIIWVIGGVINLTLMSYMLAQGLFAGNTIWAILWICINFIPLSIVIGYGMTLGLPFKNKALPWLIALFLILCIVSLYSRNFLANLAYFHGAIKFTPYILMPLQIIIIFLFVKESKHLSEISDNNIQLLVNKITELEEAEIISSDPEQKFSLQTKLGKLRKQLDELKKRKEMY